MLLGEKTSLGQHIALDTLRVQGQRQSRRPCTSGAPRSYPVIERSPSSALPHPGAPRGRQAPRQVALTQPDSGESRGPPEPQIARFFRPDGSGSQEPDHGRIPVSIDSSGRKAGQRRVPGERPRKVLLLRPAFRGERRPPSWSRAAGGGNGPPEKHSHNFPQNLTASSILRQPHFPLKDPLPALLPRRINSKRKINLSIPHVVSL